MISEDIIKGRFVSQILERDARFIAKEQAKVVEDYDLFGPEKQLYGMLINQSQGHFTISAQGASASITLKYLKYTRFLDIKDVRRKRDSYHLYNRIVFGRIYNETIQGLRYGFTRAVRETMISEIEELAATHPHLAATALKKMRK